jgi:spermidine synthase
VVVVDGYAQSHVNLEDPGDLAFEYVAQIASVLTALTTGRLAVTHIGGGGLTLPRWVHDARPGSTQIVLEPDVPLTELVRRDLPLPRGHRIRVRPVDGRTGLAQLGDATADVIVLDAYDAGRLPAELGTVEFLTDCARVLGPAGLLVANVADEPGLRYAARLGAGARTVLGHTAYVATTEVLKGRRFGNGVLVASRTPLDVGELRRHVARSAFPSGVLDDAELRRRVPGARPLTDAAPEPSPAPPASATRGRGWDVR